ncbi:hypothetical protein ACM26V_24545 [Salipaludibacillus sp. HK11]|uniref:hypothetical protein n=1 Tax=Salipaludibacillus sp. HK11 TaxID=3394320 RepID=UPI0039FC8062
MIIFLFEMLIILLASVALGSMPALKGRYPFPGSLIFFILLTIIPISIGLIVGAALFSWISAFIFKLIVILFALFIMFYFQHLYHPSYGYVPYHKKGNWLILSGFFFLLGIEFASYGFSAWFILLIVPISAAGVIGGFLFMRSALSYFRYLGVIHFVPLGLFLVVAILKLI